MEVGELTVTAPAKINLFLQVLGKRADGYHEIHTLMQAISLADELRFWRANSGISIECSDPDIPLDDSNLVARAWALMQEQFHLPGGIRAQLEKRIPSGAGLGGGSSDAAATIKAINALFKLRLERDEMLRLGSEIGSDVPFFFSSGTALAGGRGEVVDDVEIGLDCSILLIIPDFRIKTELAFDALRNSLTKYSTKSSLPLANSGAEIFATLNSIGNDFQALVCSWYPELESAIKMLLNAGAPHVALSGSGSALFALFSDPPEPSIKQEIARRIGWQTYVCLPIRLDT